MASTSQNNGDAEQTESQTQAQSESPIPILILSRSIIRPYHVLDAPSIDREAHNPLIAQWMRSLFPHPYTLLDAESWIPIATTRLPLRNYAITRPDCTYVGGIGLKPLADIESRTMEIGYWMGEVHWGAGKLEAGVFGGNEGSMAVLRKAGYAFEGRRRNAVFKSGKVLDIHMFALLREECLGSQG
ncbi:acyl-CoA N-acyltransferase [Mycena albidolilacea]|uniref:Acyl-CoA N-acyltransferase n=1 Tax=Mycena albidolilacea TaxID=1033008 RepID=A0AAD6Z1N0_9AGAR|nr:acyl-CoA N-acyltransferase [Mycena albidolilacea]